MTPLPKTEIGEVAMLLRLRRAEATVLIHECEQIIEDNANRELQIASSLLAAERDSG